MHNITVDQPLAAVVGALQESARVLESFGLDYCCGGHRSLVDSCSEAGIDAGMVLEALANVERGADPDWASMGPVELVDRIEATHHVYLHSELERLDVLAEKLAGHPTPRETATPL